MNRLAVSLALIAGTLSPALAKPGAPNGARLAHDPTLVVFVLDRSGSMTGAKLDAAKHAIKAAIDELGPDDRVAVIAFNHTVTLSVSGHGGMTATAAKAIDLLDAAGGTNFAPALSLAAKVTDGAKTKRKHVILLSDGLSPNKGIAGAIKSLRDANVTLSTVALEGADRPMLAELARLGGGRAIDADPTTLDARLIAETGTAVK